ncbi:MAG: redox-regulated ATPase YchF [Alphaproteobacteria bacterium]|nr:MAG: redox-regulated ATPase YchF [Alphaproteobacteria bacterium]
MGFKCGIVGLPNVGKSTLFNALTETAAAESANYPFTTIEPNVGRVAVPDSRLDVIARIAKSAKTIPTYLEFVDIAGLVRGASKGEGLGNQFLANIREVDAIVHVLRCFAGEVTHVEGSVDPIRDAETVETELMLADLESVERQIETATKRARGGDREARERLAVLEPVAAALRAGRPARAATVPVDLQPALRRLNLLTTKPILYVANVEEDAVAGGNAESERVAARAAAQGAGCVVISAAIEAEIAMLNNPQERRVFLETLGLAEPGLARLITAGYALLDLITFFTAGPKEARAWTLKRGATAAQAAGVIHSDFERGFIRAETISYDDYVACGGEQGAKEAGRMRAEGRDYIVQDGDIFLFRFNV